MSPIPNLESCASSSIALKRAFAKLTIWGLSPNGKEFYDTIALGGIEKTLPNGKGVMTEMADGSVVSFREVSGSDGTPVAEINIKYSSDPSGVKLKKIHFIEKKGQ